MAVLLLEGSVLLVLFFTDLEEQVLPDSAVAVGAGIGLALAFVGGMVVALLLLALRLREWRDPLPFGTFLAGATFVTLLLGETLGEGARALLFPAL